MDATTEFDTKPLLRPHQVANFEGEIRSLEEKLTNPAVQDKGEVRKQLIRTRQGLSQQRPVPPADGAEEGRMVARAKQLFDEIQPSMCSQEEMRKNPPGAVTKFNRGENSPAMKKKIAEWRNIQRRLAPDDRDAGDLERFRPVGSSLNMDNAQIPGKSFYIPPNVGAAVTFSDEEIKTLRDLKPTLADALGLLSNEQRLVVKDLIAGFVDAPKPGAAAKEKRA